MQNSFRPSTLAYRLVRSTVMRMTFISLLLLLALIAAPASAEKEKKATTHTTAVKTGLPGMTPAKKAAAAAKSAAKSTAATGVATPAAPAPYAQYRFKLQEAFCPKAEAADKATLACKSYAISKQMKTATEEEKTSLAARKCLLDDGRTRHKCHPLRRLPLTADYLCSDVRHPPGRSSTRTRAARATLIRRRGRWRRRHSTRRRSQSTAVSLAG